MWSAHASFLAAAGAADAEDAVQDAFVRYQTAGGASSPDGFLIRTTTRLCIDRLRPRQRREYVGPWVPEPVETSGRESSLAESLTQAFLLLLERLTPDERAAFLLRTVFDHEYAEIGELMGRFENGRSTLPGYSGEPVSKNRCKSGQT